MHIVFYEKPGCIGNARQKAMLTVSGHTLEVRNLLTHPFTRDELRSYLQTKPTHEWFNQSAPRIKSGEIVPSQYDEESAIDLLLREPLLIRRPLLDMQGVRTVGFDVALIESVVGPLTGNERVAEMRGQNLESCPGAQTGFKCPDANAPSAADSSAAKSSDRALSQPDQT